jgi:hypothetical protein
MVSFVPDVPNLSNINLMFNFYFNKVVISTVLNITTVIQLIKKFPVINLMMEAASTAETSVNFYHTTWCNIPKESHLHVQCTFVL